MKKHTFLHVLEIACRVGLGVLFVYSALAKISDPGDFAYSVSRYMVLPDFAIGLFSLTMPMLELLAGLSMLFTRWLRESSLLVTGMLAMFIVALVQALVRGLEISCGCFGVPSVGGREEIVMALVRDVVLIVPAVWLMFRRNTWIEPLGRMPKAWRIACLCVVGALLAVLFAREEGILETDDAKPAEPSAVKAAGGESRSKRGPNDATSGPIRAGVWSYDFTNVLAKAEREHLPMVLFKVGAGCPHCARLERCARGGAFRQWCADRAPLLALVRDESAQTPPEISKMTRAFVTNIADNLEGYPYVCVYWPRKDATNRVAFCGRGGLMGVKRRKILVMELMSALDKALGINPVAGSGYKTLDEMVKASKIKISAKAEDGGGSVTMSPKNGILPEGKTVELSAKPAAGKVFLDWRRPDGAFAGWGPRLTVYGDMQPGSYTARFRNLSECKPPLLISPAETSICIRAMNRFKYVIRVDEACRPVKFRMRSHVGGVKINPDAGVVSGVFPFPQTNTIEVAIVGYDPGRTARTVRLTIETIPRMAEDGEKGEELDDEAPDDDSDKDETEKETKK